MKSLLYALVIGFLAGVVYLIVGYIFSLDQTWSPIVAIVLVLIARHAQEQISPQPNDRQGAFVIEAIQVIATLIVVALLYQPAMGIGLTAALTVGILVWASYFVVWFVIEVLVEAIFPVSTATTGRR